ncbi:SMP-30/gluconolactonase/LRE family protein [Knoellia sp. CPCC 206435]|uniref:SMP-30/gluconolactonase/LRE family protein n=1 Tax=Knoellia terrae TaxID=3404797 RepID=UPI003B42A5E7
MITVHPVPGPGAEDVLVATHGPHAGDVFTGTEDGAIWQVSPDGARLRRVARTGGRPLGIEQAADGRLLVCDAHRGLLWVDVDSGSIEVLETDVDGIRMRFCNNAAIAADGTVWFSDSSRVHGIEEWKADFIRVTRTGRLMRLAPGGRPEVVLDGLAFANGVALSADEAFVAVAETGGRCVTRHHLTGARAGTTDLLVGDLPGYPDNISRGSDGLVWVSIASPVDPVVERLFTLPLPLRRAVTRIPERLQPAPKQTVRVQAFDDTGALVHDLDVPADGYHMVTGVREHEGRVWLGSLHEPAIAVLDR